MTQERVERTYLIGEAMVSPPTAGGVERHTQRMTYKVLSEGIAECLRYCPKGDRVLMTALQQAWVESERVRRALGEPEDMQVGFGFEDGR